MNSQYSSQETVEIPYRPPFIEGTEHSLKGESGLYIGVGFGPTYFIVRIVDIFRPDGTPKETMPSEVFRFVGYDIDRKRSKVIPETSDGLIKIVVDAIKQQK